MQRFFLLMVAIVFPGLFNPASVMAQNQKNYIRIILEPITIPAVVGKGWIQFWKNGEQVKSPAVDAVHMDNGTGGFFALSDSQLGYNVKSCASFEIRLWNDRINFDTMKIGNHNHLKITVFDGDRKIFEKNCAKGEQSISIKSR